MFGGRRPKASKEGNRAQGNLERFRRRYGNLSAAGEPVDWDRVDLASCATVKRLMNERRVAWSSVNCWTIWDHSVISWGAPPWPGRKPASVTSRLAGL